MTIASAPSSVARAGAATHQVRARPRLALRFWGLPLGAHAVVLAALLLAVLWVSNPDRLLNPDEGAAAAQANELAEGRSWTIPHPLPQVGPEGAWFPLDLSAQRAETLEFAPFAKHPVYPAVLGAAMAAGGVPLAATLSVAGTIGAALAAAVLARRLDPSLARPALWATALVSPLFYYSFVMIAHTLAAATVGLLVSVALRTVDRATVRRLVAVGVLAAIGCLLRNEAVLFGIAVAVAFGVLAIVRRRASAALAAAAVLAGTTFGYVLDSVLQALTLGDEQVRPFTINQGDFLSDRWHAFKRTVLIPAEGAPVAELGVAAATLLLVAAAILAKRRNADQRLVVVLSVGAAVAALVWITQDAVTLAVGLVFAFPLATVGLLGLSRPELARDDVRILLGVAVLFSAAVAATQYRDGDAGWGGRYFVLVVPIVVPVALLGARRLATAVDGTGGRIVRASALVVAAVHLVGATSVVGYRHDRDAAIDATLRTATAGLDAGDGDRRPVVVTTVPAVARFSWRLVADQRWLLVGPEELPAVAERLQDAGIERFLFVDNRVDETAGRLGSHYRPSGDAVYATVEWPTSPARRVAPGAVVMESADPS